MGYFLLQLTLNVTPQSVDHQSRVLLGYAAPAVHGELKTTLANAAERLKRDGASTVFSARDLSVDARAMRVGVRGQLTTFISDRRVSEVGKGYLIELQWTNGRITLKSFRETDPHDPLKPVDAADPATATKSSSPSRTGLSDVPDAGTKP
jgi:conjugal transfer pilus assembly protein TraE